MATPATNSGSGVAFTRDPATGEKIFYGEFLINAQGEDVVAGVRTPEPVTDLKKHLPKAFAELENIRAALESHFKDVQDFEFTIQDGKVFMLQTRNGKRTGVAAVRFAVRDGEGEAHRLEDGDQPRAGRSARPGARADLRPRGAQERQGDRAPALPAGPGAATGKIYFNADRAAAAAAKGEKVLLVRIETSPEDLRGMIAAEGILTARGGVSSHAALVARQMGKVCVCGAAALQHRLQGEDAEGGRPDLQGRRFPLHRRHQRHGVRGRDPDRAFRNHPGLLSGNKAAPKERAPTRTSSKLMEWCAKVTRMRSPHQCG